MSEIIYSYFKSFLNPNIVEKSYRAQRLGQALLDDSYLDIKPLRIDEAICMSWIFKIMESGFVLLSLYLGEISTRFIESKYTKFSLIFDPSYFSQKAVLLVSLLVVIFFPIVSYSYVLICRMIMKFCLEIFKMESPDETVDEIIAHSFSSNIFLIVPVFGSLLRNIAGHFFIYTGLRNNLNMSAKQATFTMLSPIFISTTLVAFMIVFFYMFISTLVLPSVGF